MRAFAIDDFGRPGSLHEVPVPEPGEGQVRVRVAAASLNPFDNAVLQGIHKDRMPHEFPLIPCFDLSGTVDAVGAGVDGLQTGDEVFGQQGIMGALGHGTLAEYTLANPASIARRPVFIDAEFGGALPLAGVSALQCIEPLHLKSGDVVVVLGAAGGIGGFAVMIAKSAGARVIGVAGGDKLEYVRGLGADEVIDHASTNVVEAVGKLRDDRIKAVVHTSGDAAAAMELATLVGEGGYVVSMRGGARADELEARHITAINVGTRTTTAALEMLAAMIKAGDVKRPAIKTFQLADAGKAFDEIGRGHVRGKLVVVP
jgi:NADPH2:quinone reductase